MLVAFGNLQERWDKASRNPTSVEYLGVVSQSKIGNTDGANSPLHSHTGSRNNGDTGLDKKLHVLFLVDYLLPYK